MFFRKCTHNNLFILMTLNLWLLLFLSSVERPELGEQTNERTNHEMNVFFFCFPLLDSLLYQEEINHVQRAYGNVENLIFFSIFLCIDESHSLCRRKCERKGKEKKVKEKEVLENFDRQISDVD